VLDGWTHPLVSYARAGTTDRFTPMLKQEYVATNARERRGFADGMFPA
jgi:hypothetical protein